ncbi:sodium:dicarboxylate symporter, partial [Sinorhizobium medicae]
MPDQKKRPPARKLFAIAALLGVIAGAAAVYVKETGSGNGGDAPTADASCPLA